MCSQVVKLRVAVLQELHDRYYEPYAEEKGSTAAILQGPPVKKLLYMTAADIVTSKIIPHWEASTCQNTCFASDTSQLSPHCPPPRARLC